MKFVVSTLSFLIFFPNLLLWMGGLLALLLGLFHGLALDMPPNPWSYNQETSRVDWSLLFYTTPYTVLFYNGVFLFLTANIGFLVVFLQKQLCFATHVIAIIATLVFDAQLGYAMYWNSSAMINLMGEMDEAMYFNHLGEPNVYREDIGVFSKSVEHYWDTLQRSRRCCGLNGLTDWENKTLNDQFHSHSIPNSCCYEETPNCGLNFWRLYSTDPYSHYNIRHSGCLTTFPEIFTTRYQSIFFIPRYIARILIWTGICSMMLWLISFLKTLKQRSLKKLRIHHEPLQLTGIEDPPPLEYENRNRTHGDILNSFAEGRWSITEEKLKEMLLNPHWAEYGDSRGDNEMPNSGRRQVMLPDIFEDRPGYCEHTSILRVLNNYVVNDDDSKINPLDSVFAQMNEISDMPPEFLLLPQIASPSRNIMPQIHPIMEFGDLKADPNRDVSAPIPIPQIHSLKTKASPPRSRGDFVEPIRTVYWNNHFRHE